MRTIKALRISVDEDVKVQDVQNTAKDVAHLGISALLLDSKTSDMPAGTGVSSSWEIAKQVRRAIDVPLIIAGGLNPENVRDAIRSIRPFAVDVISSVKGEPGKKDARKVQAFIQSVKGQR